MSWVAAAVASASATVAGYKAIHGAHQKNKARKMKVDRPVMGRSKASIEQENMYRNMANANRMPGQSIAENNIGAQSARDNSRILQTGGSTGDVIQGISMVDQNSRMQQNDLAAQAGQYNQRNKELFGDVLSGVSQDQKELFDYNSNQPYQTAALRKQALMDSGERNINNAADSFMDSSSQFGGSYASGMGASGSRKSGPSASTSRR